MSDGPSCAFVPGHVTVFFSPYWDNDPAKSGSVGGGVTLSNGVTTTVTPSGETDVLFNGTRITMDPVQSVLTEFGATVRIEIETPLPLGAGFGVSGAATLGVALAINDLTTGNRSENELISLAHCAEVNAGTGLGDVVAQARGGVPIRTAPGAPPNGSLDGIPAKARIEYYPMGDLDTKTILSDDSDELTTYGEVALDSIRESPQLRELFSLGREFAGNTGLVTPGVNSVIEDVQAEGGDATMALLGKTVIAIGTGLSDAGYDAASCSIHPSGARLMDQDRSGTES